MTLNGAAVRYQHTAAVLGCLLNRYAPATANRILSALGERSNRHGYLVRCLQKIIIALHASHQSSETHWNPQRSHHPIMFGAGLRREEVTTLNLDDYDSGNAKLVVRGKRSKQRITYLGDGALAALRIGLNSVAKARVRFFFP